MKRGTATFGPRHLEVLADRAPGIRVVSGGYGSGKTSVGVGFLVDLGLRHGHLGPILVDILARFDADSPRDFGTAVPHVTMSTGKTYEDDAAKVQRVLDLKAAGIIDDADARVMIGLDKDRASALAYLESIRTTAQPRVSLPGALAGSPFTAPRETTEQ